MAGAKLNRTNRQRIQDIADRAYAMGARPPAADTTPIGKAADMPLQDQIEAVARAVYRIDDADGYCFVEEVYDGHVIIELSVQNGSSHWRADYSQAESGAITLAARDTWVQVEERWVPVETNAKAGQLDLDDNQRAPVATMKAAGDRQLEVLVAFGSSKSKDAHGEYFSPRTDFAVEDFPTPPLMYYHGADQRTNRSMKKPVSIGKMLKRWDAADGHHLLYQLKSNRWADMVWDDACKGAIPASPGTVGYLGRREADGELTYWPLAEMSAWDRAGGRKQAYSHTVAVAVLKAHYLEAGIPIPSSLDAPSEAAGDAASTEPIDPEAVKQILAAEVRAGLLSLRGTNK